MTIAGFARHRAKKGETVLQELFSQIAPDQHYPRAAIVARPVIKWGGRMEDMLNTVQDKWRRNAFDVDDTFEP